MDLESGYMLKCNSVYRVHEPNYPPLMKTNTPQSHSKSYHSIDSKHNFVRVRMKLRSDSFCTEN
jgi:hypothetical protein